MIDIQKLIGEKFERWTILDFAGRNKHGAIIVKCQCSCSEETIKNVCLNDLKFKKSKSCGCINRELTVKRQTKHGHGRRGKKHKLYRVWEGIKQRCLNPDNEEYKNYGRRGIIICEKWKRDFQLFYNWCLENGWKEELQIDRIDNDGNYEPENCRFVTNQINMVNQQLLQSNNSSGYCGVSFRKKENVFTSRVSHKGKIVFSEYGFLIAIAAAIARDNFIIKNGLKHPLNFPKLEEK